MGSPQDVVAAARGATALRALQYAAVTGRRFTMFATAEGLTLRIGPAEGPGPRILVRGPDLDSLLSQLSEVLEHEKTNT